MLQVTLGSQYLEGLMCLYSDSRPGYNVFRGKAEIPNGLPCVFLMPTNG